ncbi:histidine phosphatase family protein [Neobacillus sp. MM2021_6]|uniref:histidine phosphatase family protein n=1 Tax=Neobacillus sp. MM2021_6 TaxID=2817026 RepID=UPI00325BDDFC
MRHGETDWNAIGRIQGSTDIPLNEKGVQQAEECGVFLKRTSWDVIITSPLKRAKVTAEIINSSINIPLVVMEEFKEKFFGEAEGLTFEERKAKYPDHRYPNEEDELSLSKRVMAGLDKIKQEYRDQKVLLVIHGAVINSILAEISNGELDYRKTKIENACFNDIHFHENRWKIKTLNQVSHLSQYC